MTTTTELAELAELAENRDNEYRDFAVMHDLSAYDLNRFEERSPIDDPYPFEVSGDALARYKAKHDD